ncbi:BLUF domain-containing protein [Luminiphilus sp. nBUS_16]|uniref:BLUF domain-containing protein n=1 Tax=Luminiphilus sp. nBUS_16 TaxID=3395315 RepID=UPI003EBD5E8D
MTDLYHLAYVSDVLLETSQEEPAQAHLDGQLQEILATAKKNNQEKDLTGALLFSGSHFAQVLEGPEAAINERFKLISQDTRHHNVTPLLYEPAGERQFKGWSMALCMPEDLESLPALVRSKPSPGSVEASDLGKGLIASLAAAIGRRTNSSV